MRLPAKLQRALIFPGSLLPEPQTNRLTTRSRRIAGPDGQQIALYHQPRAQGDLHVLFFYGNAMTLADCEPIVDGFAAASAGITVPDYLGYGLSEGTASEANCYAVAEHVLGHLTRDHGISPRQLVIAGWSLGAAVALQAALRHQLAGLIMLSPFTSLADAARQVVSILPGVLARALIGDAFDNASRLVSLRCPLLLAHGERDRLLPIRMSRQLHSIALEAGLHVQLVEVPEADHGDLFAVGGPALWRQIDAFLRALR